MRFYPAMLKAVAEAEASITIEAYIYWAGDIGLEFARALAARSKEGVIVKILLDAVGSSTIGDEILEILEKGKCQLAWYNPVRPYNLGRFNHRTHRKSLIVDGRIAFTGGAGIADHWMGDAQDKDHWRDIQIRLEGPAVGPLQTGFAQNWLKETSELITGSEFYPHRRTSQWLRRGPDDSQLSGDGRVDRPHVLLPVHRRGAADAVSSRTRTLFPIRAPSTCSSRRANAASTSGSWSRASTTTTGWPDRTASGSTARCSRRASRSTNTTTRCCIRRRWSSTACGRPWARPTSTAAPSRTTKRTTSASAIGRWRRNSRRHSSPTWTGATPSPTRPGVRDRLLDKVVQAVVSLLQEQV